MKLMKRAKHALRVEEISTTLGMVDIFEIFKESPYSFFLDSGMDEGKLGRYSFMGSVPFLLFRSKGERIEVIHDGEIVSYKGNAFQELRKLMAQYKIDPKMLQGVQKFGFPFLGGAVGYFGYEMNHCFEKLPDKGVDDLGLPDCYFMFVNSVVVYDNLYKKMYISTVAFDEQGDDPQERVKKQHEEIKMKIATATPGKVVSGNCSHQEERNLPIRAMIERQEYIKKILKAKEYISEGHIYEVCLTHRLDTEFSGNSFELYRELRKINPAPFASFLNFPEVNIVSSDHHSEGWARASLGLEHSARLVPHL